MPRRVPLICSSLGGLLAALAGCGSAPAVVPPGDPAEALALADRLLKTDPAAACSLLEGLDPDAMPRAERAGHAALYAEALLQTGEPWDGFEQIRSFGEDHRFSEWMPRVEDTHFRIGRQLIESDASWFIFGSDRDDGEIVLQEFVERYSANPHVPDALRLLGDLAFDEERWQEARRRYEQILAESPGSEWAPLAAFRRVMSIHADLLGPEYDLPEMLRARNELRDYLATEPEREDFRAPAAAALAEVDDWVGQRHMIDAEFYRTVGNEPGERFHLERLIGDTPTHSLVPVAKERLARLDAGRPQ